MSEEQTMTLDSRKLEDYLRENLDRASPVIDHALRAHQNENGGITFYIHPANADGETLDFSVNGNELHCITRVAVASPKEEASETPESTPPADGGAEPASNADSTDAGASAEGESSDSANAASTADESSAVTSATGGAEAAAVQ